jgi:hypothetical protein
MTYLLRFQNIFDQALFKQNLLSLVYDPDNAEFISYNSTFAKLKLYGRSNKLFTNTAESLIPDMRITLKTKSNGKLKYIKY